MNRIKSWEVQAWIEKHIDKDIRQLALQKAPFADIMMIALVQQVYGRKIARKKFDLLDRTGIVFPQKINLEQTSSAITAAYKSNIIDGKTMLDATGGMGIDTLFFAQKFKKVVHIELNKDLQKIAASNFKTLGMNQIQSINQDFLEFLNNTESRFDAIYLDPSRRDAKKNKVFMLEDLQPNILEIQDLLLSKADNVLVKLSPLIDINYLTKTLPYVTEVHIVAIKNEVKEILVKMENYSFEPIKMIAINLETAQSEFVFNFHEIQDVQIAHSDAEKYIYEPNVAIRKSGGMDILASKFHLQKLHPNTQLYTSTEVALNYPGRIFEVKEKLVNPKKELKNKSIMAIHRNFPQNLTELKKRYSFHTDGVEPVLFTKSINEVYLNWMEEIEFE